MMKRLLTILSFIPLLLDAQIKMSDFPVYAGNPNGNYVPVIIANTNRKVDASYFGYNKLDSFSVSMGSTYDTLYAWKNGAKSFYKLTRASAALSSTSDLPEGVNLYFTTARARAAISQGFGLIYSSGQFRVDTSTLDARYTTNLVFDETIQYSGETVGVNKQKLHRFTKVVSDANYTITPDDECIVLPDPTVSRNCTLIAASSMQGLTVTIICAATSTGEWILLGSFVQTATTGSSPFTENFTNSTLAPGQRLRLTSINDNGTWRWFDTN